MTLWGLGQTPPDRRPGSALHLLPTIIRNTGILWHDGKRRWLTASEMLAAMGFPISRSLC
jgi:hypothetical protein